MQGNNYLPAKKGNLLFTEVLSVPPKVFWGMMASLGSVPR